MTLGPDLETLVGISGAGGLNALSAASIVAASAYLQDADLAD